MKGCLSIESLLCVYFQNNKVALKYYQYLS